MYYRISLILFTFLLLGGSTLWAQSEIDSSGTPTEKDRVVVDHADVGEYIQEEGRTLQRLLKEARQVELRQEDVFMYCDTAIIEDNNVTAYGQVIIQQGDSLSIFADSLSYQGDSRIADLFGQVILVNDQEKLFTNRLNYDLNSKVATYRSGATLTNDTTQLTSQIGYYYVDENEAYFKDSVVVIDPEFILRSDTLQFNTQTRLTTFLGPTLITQDSANIYCESGYYDIRDRSAEFRDNPQYVKGEQKAWAEVIRYDGKLKEVQLIDEASFIEGDKKAFADTIRYEENTKVTWLEGNAHFEDTEQVIDSERIRYNSEEEAFSTSGRSRISDPPQILVADEIDYLGDIGQAKGNVIWRDTTEQTTIVCEQADYNKETDYLLASGDRPLLISLIDEDSLFLRADSLISFREAPEDSTRTLVAYQDVRMYKSNLQAVCDSLTYSTKDSLFEFFDDPIIWSDTTQFSADTVRMQLVDQQIDQILLYNKALIVNSTDEILFNQIKGRTITAFFETNELRRMMVEGNAESIYYAQDEAKAYIGLNKTVCSRMLLYFGNNKVEDIHFYATPKGNFIPIGRVNFETEKLDGFRWETKRRPFSLQDLK
ncbi:MAG: OstA-like protein [Bacteroidota bacterium]